jgi:mannitol/fructose-specific phosphotransferase system IIA component (Ntr-type)
MITIADTLAPDRIRLNLPAQPGPAAIDEVAEMLRNAPEVVDWEVLHELLPRSSPCLVEAGGEFAVCLPHARTDAVTSMVMAVGRSPEGLPFEGCIAPVRYIFCIGVPKALATDYLRIVGLLARILKHPATEAALRDVESPQKFIDELSVLEATL